MDVDNRRKSPRLPVQARVGFAGQREGTLRNLSMGGCQMESDNPGHPGDYLLLRVFLPDDPTPLQINSAAVRWSHGKDFGVAFLAVQTQEQERLHRYLTYLQGG
jgi:hypothetical protein